MIGVPVFPSDAEVISEETARFRRLTPEERLLSIQGILEAGALMMQQSPKARFLKEWTQFQEAVAKQSVKDFLARHAHFIPATEQ